LCSRLGFYALVLLVMWTTSLLLPDPYAYEQSIWEEAGVVRPYYGVSVEDLDFELR
jgi:hypothetical protein